MKNHQKLYFDKYLSNNMSVKLMFYGYLLVALTKSLNFLKMLKNLMKISAKQSDFFFQNGELARNETANFEEWYRLLQWRISEVANIEGDEFRGIPVPKCKNAKKLEILFRGWREKYSQQGLE